MITKTCTVSGQKFVITDEDIVYYEKMGVPAPTLCPEERRRRRMSWRNESSLYHQTCGGSGKKMICMYNPEKGFIVYDNTYWWGDDWDAIEYGLDFDFNRPFFPQFFELLKTVPKMARIQQGDDQNSTFTNCASYNKNCYMLFSSNENEDCMYGDFMLKNKDCVDGTNNQKCELCYEIIDSTFCYEVQHSERVHNSRSMYHCYDCRNSENCFACASFWNKKNKYWVLNKEVSKEEFEALLKNPAAQQEVLRQFPALRASLPERGHFILQSENVTGAYIRRSKNALDCWNIEDCEDCKFCNDLARVKSSYDVSNYGCTETNELLYECEGVGHGVFNVKFSKLCWGGCSDIQYSYECFASKNLFGCTGLRHKQYCIFNKQYSKEAYEKLVPKIIEHMKRTGEYGEFFPTQASPFAYNETVAMDHLPLTQAETIARGYNWKDETSSTQYEGPSYEIPRTIAEVDDDILEKILTCTATSKKYRIVRPELEFYRKNNIPIPHSCPDERHRKRLEKRPPRKLYEHACAQCKTLIKTTFSPKKSHNVICDKCYLNFVQ